MRAVPKTYAIVSALAMVAYPFLPDVATDTVYLLSSFSVLFGIWWGVRSNRPAVRPPWLLLLAGFAAYGFGDTASLILKHMDTETPVPSVADLAYLLFYPLLYLAVARFLAALGNPDRAAWVDASIWTIGAGVVLWEPLIGPYAVDSSSGLVAYAVYLAYPLLDLGLLLMVLRMVAGRASLHPAYVLLVAGLFVQVTTDVVYAVRAVEGIYVAGEPTDVGWILVNLLVGSAAMHPSMTRMTKRAREPITLASRHRLQALLAPALLAPALVVYQLLSNGAGLDRTDAFFAAIVTAVLLVLVVSRGRGLLTIAEERSDELAHRTAALEVALEDGETASQELRTRMDRDALTGLANRDFFVERLNAELAAWDVGGPRPSIAFLDLDDFKSVNDSLGHAAGDTLLVEVASRLRNALRSHHLVARFGGDEFAVLLVGDVEQAAERLLDVLRPTLLLNGNELRLGASIGVTTAARHGCSPGDMLREADIAMYTAKRAGGGWTRYQGGMSTVLLERLDMRARLVQALRDGDIEPWFQPIVEMSSGKLVGFEVLARWCTPGEATREPAEWMMLAEETGLVTAVDRAVLRAAVMQFSVWRQDVSGSELDIAINLSGRTLQQPGIEDELLEVLRLRRVPADRLIVEVTEGVLIDDPHVGVRLQRLRAAGVRIALDDFGTGWSSLSYLRRFPVDQLKLDRSFTLELGLVPGADAVPAAIIQLARALALKVVAEGVETSDQRDRLTVLGFDVAQGYLFGEAERGQDCAALIRQSRTRFGALADVESAQHVLRVVR